MWSRRTARTGSRCVTRFAAYSRRVGKAYREAVSRHLRSDEPAHSERLLEGFAAWRRRRLGKL